MLLVITYTTGRQCSVLSHSALICDLIHSLCFHPVFFYCPQEMGLSYKKYFLCQRAHTTRYFLGRFTDADFHCYTFCYHSQESHLLSPNTAASISESLPAMISQGVFKERDSHPLLKARSISAATRPEALQYIGHM